MSIISSHSVTPDFLPTKPLSAVTVSKATKRLKRAKCMGMDGIPSFITKECFHILIKLLTCILTLA
jgi:hypothetical protein